MKKLFVLVCLFLTFSCSKVVDEADSDNQSVVEASSSQDQLACEYAKNAKNVEVWRFYLKEFPNGLCNSEAKDAIINNYFEKKSKAEAEAKAQREKAEAEAKAREEQLYKEAREKNTLDAWENYSREFPEGEHAFEAKFKIRDIKPVHIKPAVNPKPEVEQQAKPEYVQGKLGKPDSQNEKTSLKAVENNSPSDDADQGQIGELAPKNEELGNKDKNSYGVYIVVGFILLGVMIAFQIYFLFFLREFREIKREFRDVAREFREIKRYIPWKF